MANTTFSEWYSLQDWIAQRRAQAFLDDSDDDADKSREFALKLSKTKEADVSIRYIVSPNASGQAISLDITSLQVSHHLNFSKG